MTFQYCFDGSIKKVNNLSVSSPRTWGCFQKGLIRDYTFRVFPTHVGVFLADWSDRYQEFCLPHARGGVSHGINRRIRSALSSPRTWGCFRCELLPPVLREVFPTHVGVFLCDLHSIIALNCLPHARGGVSAEAIRLIGSQSSSPRTWGCFRYRQRKGPGRKVFPTHVGVFPQSGYHPSLFGCLPHARGGVSL